ncbi:MAG: lysylphosphatidylglycerol synthase transmembrane domain-containing protein [Gammaproteobacteria bacterium]
MRFAGLKGWPLRALWLSVLAGAGGYLAFALWGGWRDTVNAVAAIGLPALLAALALSLVNYGLRFVRWQGYLAALDSPVPAAPSLAIYLGGFALTTTPGKAGEGLRSLFLKPLGVSYPKSLAALVSERLSDLIAMVLLAALGVWAFPVSRPLVLGLLPVLLLVLVLLVDQRALQWLYERAAGGAGRLRRLFGHLLEIVLHSGACYRPRLLLGGLVLGLLAWGAEGLAFHLMLERLHSGISLQVAVFIYAFAVLVGALSFLPGGLGGTELTMTGLLVLQGLDPAQAVAVTVLIRLATLWFAVALGLVALLVLPRIAPAAGG